LHTKVIQLKKIKVGAVSYLNTKPLLYGIKRSDDLLEKMELIEDYPSKIAQMLLDDEIDVGLVPVAIIPKMKEHFIVTDYCIGTEGEVASVCLFSEVPIEQVTKILLDYQSRTSVNLVKILLKQHWKLDVYLEDAQQDFREQIKDTTAAVVIGDRALVQRKISPFVYDLGLAWKAMTGLPFMFAAWIANKKLNDSFVEAFNKANAYGVHHIDDVVQEQQFEQYDLKKYYTENISYKRNRKKMEALQQFISLLT
jgi:chorismate dehydratase